MRIVTTNLVGRHLFAGVFLVEMSAREARAVAALWAPMRSADANGRTREALDYARQILSIATNVRAPWLMPRRKLAKMLVDVMEAAGLVRRTEQASVAEEAKAMLMFNEVIWEICGIARMTDRQLLDNIGIEQIADFYRALRRQRLDDLKDVVMYQSQFSGDGQKKIVDSLERQKKSIPKPGKGYAKPTIPQELLDKKREAMRAQRQRNEVVW